MTLLRRAAGALVAALGVWSGAVQAQSESLRFCDRGPALSASQQDQLLRFAAIVRGELEASGQALALVARSGMNLRRFGIRYSHAGISLRASSNSPWSVRQLYYACDEGRPRLFDQGLAGFVYGTDNPSQGHISIVLLPEPQAGQLEQAALDNARALRLLAATYSANAYAYSTRYQNCNQWVIEMLASAWADLRDGEDLRQRSQNWLAEQSYAPQTVQVGSHWLMFAGGFVPWLSYDDHPEQNRFALRFLVSVPESIESFVHRRLPAAQRVELCHAPGRVVIRRGWEPLPDDCRPGAGDRVVGLD